MLRDPRVAPRVVVAPLVGVQVDGAVVDGGDGQVLLEVDAFVAGVGVALLVVGQVGRGGGEPAFVAEGDQVSGVQRFDVSGSVGGPFGDDARGTAGAAGFVHQLPAEDGGASLVAVDDEFDVVLVGGLSGGVGIEVIVGAAVDVAVGVDAAQVVIVVVQDKNDFDAILGGGRDGVVEAGDTVVGVVIEVLPSGVEDLVVDVVGGPRGIIGRPEAPDSNHFVAGLEEPLESFLLIFWWVTYGSYL